MEKLRRLIVFFVSNFPRPLSRTELVKVIYLFEYELVQIQGHQYSEVAFVRDKYGPFAASILTEAESLCSAGVICCERNDIDSDCILYEYTISDRTRASDYDLPWLEKGIALAIINRTAGLTLKEIKELTYSTPPMNEILNEEAKLGRIFPPTPRRINMEKGKAPKRFTKEELAAAKRRLDASSDRGTDEEYFADLLATHKEFEDLRRRATGCLLRN